MLQLVTDIKVIGNGAFTATGDQRAVRHSGFDGLFNAVLHQWLIHHRKHLLRHALGGRQKPRAVARNGEQTFTNHAELSSRP